MAAFMKIDGIPGQATDANHKEWILIESFSQPIYRQIAQGARDNERFQSDTKMGDMVVVRTMDKSSPKLFGFCANGTPIKELLIHATGQAAGDQKVYLEYKLENVVVSSYSAHGNSETKGSEECTFNCTKIGMTYFTLDPKDAAGKGKVVAEYDLGAGK